jgi:hypothetical protein
MQLIKTITIVTLTIAGSSGTPSVGCGFGGSQTCRSLMSWPRNIMNSKISFLGGKGLSVGRSSVPKDRTVESNDKISN